MFYEDTERPIRFKSSGRKCPMHLLPTQQKAPLPLPWRPKPNPLSPTFFGVVGVVTLHVLCTLHSPHLEHTDQTRRISSQSPLNANQIHKHPNMDLIPQKPDVHIRTHASHVFSRTALCKIARGIMPWSTLVQPMAPIIFCYWCATVRHQGTATLFWYAIGYLRWLHNIPEN